MNKKLLYAGLLPAMAGFLLAGCSSMEYPRSHSNRIAEDFHAISYTGDLRGAYVVKKGEAYWVLSEPRLTPAFSYEASEGLDVSLLAFGGDEGGGEGFSSGSEDLPLTGRTSYLLLARELFYRVNEMAFNTNATYDQYYSAFKDALDVVKEVAKIEAVNVKYTADVKVNTGATASLSLEDKISDQTSITEQTEIKSGAASESDAAQTGASNDKKKNGDDDSGSGDSSNDDDEDD